MSWSDPSKYVQHIYVEESCLPLDYTREILDRVKLPYSVIEDRTTPGNIAGEYPDNLTQGKKHLLLAKNRGTFFKPCPATREYTCCEYHVLNIGMNCPMDCVYCILQAYLNNPWLSFYMNIDQMFDEMDTIFATKGDEFFRIGTGEFTDSLALDSITRLSEKLVRYMAAKNKGILELKTKSTVIESLEGLDHGGRTVVAWSLNSEEIMTRDEFRVATLEERLQAARKCADWGYKLAFHFDPIVIHDNWEQGYLDTIDKLFAAVPSENIVWISMGALRYLPELKRIGISRFPSSRMYYNEFVEGLDGKARYFRDQRVKLYKKIYPALLEKSAAKTCIYFCMESDEIWYEVMGYTPKERGGLRKMLDRTVQ